MDQVKTVNWRSWDEWNHVYQLLYSDNKDDVIKGCNIVDAWAARQPIPTAIEVTASMQRELHGEKNVFALSMAIIRFINGIIEPFKNSNLSAAISSIGEMCNIPDYIISIRHSATHGKIPTFELAARGARHSLVWLNEHYWTPQYQKINDIHLKLNESFEVFLQTGQNPFYNIEKVIIFSFGIQKLIDLMLREQFNDFNNKNLIENIIGICNATSSTYTDFMLYLRNTLRSCPPEKSEIANRWLQILPSHENEDEIYVQVGSTYLCEDLSLNPSDCDFAAEE